MTTATAGDIVSIHYTGTLADGTQFDSSEGRDPLSFTLGSGQIIKGLDAAITGLEEGAESTVTIPAADAYGDHDPAQIQQVARDTIPAEIPLEVGLQLQAQTQQGGTIALIVTDIQDGMVTLDANHPLAGKELTFKFNLISVGRPE